MGRMTRAKAAEAAERMHIEEDAVLELPSEDTLAADTKPTTPERPVLGEIAPNSTESKTSTDIVPKKTRGQKKAERKNNIHVEVDPEATERIDEVAATNEQKIDEIEEAKAEEDALDATTNETMERLAKLRITSLGNGGAVPTTTPAQLESSETHTAASESITPVLDETATIENEESPAPLTSPIVDSESSELPSISIDTALKPEEDVGSASEANATIEAPGSPIAAAVPKVVKDLRMDTPGKRSTSNKENVEPSEPVEPVQAASPSVSANAQPASPSQNAVLDAATTQEENSPPTRPSSSNKSEDPIEALDELDDAVEKVNLEISAPTSSPERKQVEKPTEEKEKGKHKKTKSAPVVRLTKATQARLSMAQGGTKDQPKASASNRPRPSTTLGRASSVRQSVVPSAAQRDAKATRTSSKPDARPKKETVIPHSKPRPVSLSFPTPPPPPKSQKAPTKSSFQLPGEAVAAKLKAAREERMKREATVAASKSKENNDAAAAEKKPAFKARPVPSALKKTPSIRQTAASRARESIMTGGPSTAAPTTKPRASTTASAPKTSQPSLTVTKRPRPSSVQLPAGTSTAATRNPSSSSANAARSTSATSKGKEVYARAGAAKEAAEAAKREKEDAARKARAAAAERGRALSREWAEKQKAKKAAAAAPATVKSAAPAVGDAPAPAPVTEGSDAVVA